MDSRTAKGKDRHDFEVLEFIRTTNGELHKRVKLVRKKQSRYAEGEKYSYHWFMKPEFKMNNPTYEVITQELFRLLIPYQPKTRLLIDRDINLGNNKYSIISKAVGHFQSFSNLCRSLGYIKFKSKLLSEAYSGLGSVIVASLFTGEVDLHNRHLGIDSKNRVVKIDGSLGLRSDRIITEADIAVLPDLAGDYPINWLDINCYQENHEKSVLSDEAIFQDVALRYLPNFRHDVNLTLLKISLLPTALLTRFVRGYVDDEEMAESIQAYILERQAQIKMAALADSYFHSYVLSPAAINDIKEYLSYLDTFCMMGKEYIMRNNATDFKFSSAMGESFREMYHQIQAKQPTRWSTLMSYVGLHSSSESDEEAANRLRARRFRQPLALSPSLFNTSRETSPLGARVSDAAAAALAPIELNEQGSRLASGWVPDSQSALDSALDDSAGDLTSTPLSRYVRDKFRWS